MRVSVSGVFFALLLAVVSYNGALLLASPLLLLVPISLSIFRRWLDHLFAMWCYLPPAMMELLFGVRVRVCGDLQRVRGPCLILLNHRTRFDWLFFWCYLVRMGNPSKHKIVLKEPLKKVPGFGWGMQICQFLFITRNWARDKKILSDNLSYFCSRGYPVQLLFFPEGTDLSEANRAKGHQFAEKNGLEKYDHVLHPRTTGFVHCLQELRRGATPPTVVNVSVGYVGNIPQNERDILAGRWPTEMHFHAETLADSDIPREDAGIAEWLRQVWRDKEKLLKRFYEDGHFQSPYLEQSGSNTTPCLRLSMIACLVFWLAFVVASLYVILAYHFMLWLVLGLTVFYVLVAVLGPGLDWLILQLHQMTYQAKLFK